QMPPRAREGRLRKQGRDSRTCASNLPEKPLSRSCAYCCELGAVILPSAGQRGKGETLPFSGEIGANATTVLTGDEWPRRRRDLTSGARRAPAAYASRRRACPGTAARARGRASPRIPRDRP